MGTIADRREVSSICGTMHAELNEIATIKNVSEDLASPPWNAHKYCFLPRVFQRHVLQRTNGCIHVQHPRWTRKSSTNMRVVFRYLFTEKEEKKLLFTTIFKNNIAIKRNNILKKKRIRRKYVTMFI